ncbi:CHAP domain-containing protein [Methylobacterium nonmethylotrophicum]|uniref:CHAP domain-containing protein n=1 Tax=Methylobacterium nonmethylotrophicum TaxID=1141884 RepID=A0A4Z0NKQ5_9HYPH|nr:CHAP domain-containing protein [Methylobacterium nonmethylotrophicum]TGD96781.1 CHAP domain-containing protein [Methylobacterium nonmethylotrophicum]
MNVKTLILRATSAIDQNVKYKSPGVTPSLSANKWPSSEVSIDCSGFVAWCFRVSRKVDHPLYKKVNGGWFETTGIHADVGSSVGYFSQISKPKVGCILVYPDYKGSDGKVHDGHMGIVLEVDDSKTGIAAVTSIVHCSVSNDRTGSAIQATGPAIWLNRKESLIGWRDDLDE